MEGRDPRQELERRDLLLEAGMVLASELSLRAVLQRIVELAVKVTGARYGALGVLGSEGYISHFETTGVTEEQRRAIGHYPIGLGILGVLIHEAEPLRLRSIEDDPRHVGFPPNHPKMRSFLGVPVKARGKVFGNIYLTEKQGAEEFDEPDEHALEILASQAGLAIENAALYEEARTGERRLDAVREVSTRILEGGTPEEVLGLVADRARELVGAALATIATPGGDGELELAAVSGERREELLGRRFPVEGSISGTVMRTGEPVALGDAGSEGDTRQPVFSLSGIGPCLFVPLLASGSPSGTLLVANPTGGRPFTPEDMEVVQTFAGQASVAIEYGRARRDLERLAVLEDRERIAKELHDGVIQSLFAVGMGLQGAAALSKDPEIERRVDGAVGEIDRVIRDLRSYIFGLRPGILADRRLDQALHELTADFEAKTGVVTVAQVDPEVAARLSSRASDMVQLVREALSNVGRHAGAATCRVSLVAEGSMAVLEIDDDGRGFDPAKRPGTGQGMGNLRERARSLGGDIRVDSESGQGTTVRAMLPM